MAQKPTRKINPDAYCDTCPFKHWIVKEHLLSQEEKKPIILECHETGERIVRGTKKCAKHPNYYL